MQEIKDQFKQFKELCDNLSSAMESFHEFAEWNLDDMLDSLKEKEYLARVSSEKTSEINRLEKENRELAKKNSKLIADINKLKKRIADVQYNPDDEKNLLIAEIQRKKHYIDFLQKKLSMYEAIEYAKCEE